MIFKNAWKNNLRNLLDLREIINHNSHKSFFGK